MQGFSHLHNIGSDRVIELAIERSNDRAIDRASDRASDRAIERTTERSSGRANDRVSDRTSVWQNTYAIPIDRDRDEQSSKDPRVETTSVRDLNIERQISETDAATAKSYGQIH